MTTQVADTFRYQSESFDVLDTSGVGLFMPAAHGLKCFPPSTGCWKGFVAEYVLHERCLVLGALQIQLDVPETFEEPPLIGPIFHGVRARLAEHSQFGRWHFHGLGMPVDYSGGILIGRQYIQEHRIYLAPHAWNFQTVVELVFEKGRLVEELDHSERVAEVRRRILAEGKEQPGFWKETREWMQGFLRERYRMGAF